METPGRLSLTSSEAVLLVRAIHALIENVDAARHSHAMSIDAALRERDELMAMDRKVKDAWAMDWTKTGYALGR